MFIFERPDHHHPHKCWKRLEQIAKLYKQLDSAHRNQHRDPMLRLQVKALKQQISQLENKNV